MPMRAICTLSLRWRPFFPLQLRSVCSMESLETFLAPPQSAKGMQTLDRTLFRREITLPAIRLQDVSHTAKFLQRLKDTVLWYPGIKKVVDLETGDGKVSRKAAMC